MAGSSPARAGSFASTKAITISSAARVVKTSSMQLHIRIGVVKIAHKYRLEWAVLLYRALMMHLSRQASLTYINRLGMARGAKPANKFQSAAVSVAKWRRGK